MSKWKKAAAMIMVFGMCLTAACGNAKGEGTEGNAPAESGNEDTGNQAQTGDEKTDEGQESLNGDYKIAVAIPDYGNAQMNMFKKIYEEQIAPAFHVEFIFSEALNNDIAAEMQFMENAKSSGANGYITYNISTVEHAENICAKANDMQLYLSVNGVPSENVNELPFLTGAVDASAGVDIVAEQFQQLTDILLSDQGEHNVVICTMGAAVGSVQHIQSTAAALDAIAKVYGLTYDGASEEIAKAQNVTEISTGTERKICLIPGPTPAVVSDVEQVIKGGEYDVLICVGPQYAWYESVIKAVEDNLKMDIRTCSIMGISEATATSFHTEDATGNPSLNCALLKNSSVADQLFVLVYNALTGDPDAYKRDGKAQVFPNIMWLCSDAEAYDQLSQVDSTPELACYSAEEMKAVLSAVDSSVNADKFQAWCESADAKEVLSKLNLDK